MIGEKAAKGLRPFAPQSFGRYTLLAPLASGGMGEVYLGRLEGVEGFEKLVVIKKILPQLAHDDDFRSRFVSEARVLVKLHHGSVAQVLDMGEREGELYIALEFVDGKDLRKVAARCKERGHTVPLGLTLFVMMRVLDALAYAHRKKDEADQDLNLVHRDVSPQNVLISYEGEVKVIDFGLAKSSLSLGRTSPSVVLGKFFYMSPEQARHQKVDKRSDLYAAGICLYELIAGKNPFESVAQGELMAKVANPQIEPLGQAMPGVPPAVEQLVMRALAPDPKDRFASAEEMRGRLMAAMLELDPAAGPESLAHFMRAVFSGEHAQERKVFSQLRDAAKEARPDARTGLMPILQIADSKPPDARANTVVAEVAQPAKPLTPATAETHVGPVPESNRATLAAMPALPEPSQTDVFHLPSGRDADATRPADTGEMPALPKAAASTGEMRAIGAELDGGATEGAFEFQMPEETPADTTGHRTTDPARAPIEPSRRATIQLDAGPRLSPPPGALPGLMGATGPISAIGDDPQEFQLPGHDEPKLEPSQPIIQAAIVDDEPPRAAPPVLASNVPGPPVLSATPTPRAPQAPRATPPAPPAPRPPAPAKPESPGLPKVVIAAELATDPPRAPASVPPARRANAPPAGQPRRPPSPSNPGTPALSSQPTQRVVGEPLQIKPTEARTAPSKTPSNRNSLLVGLAIGAGMVLVVVVGLLAWSFSHPG